MPTSAGPEPAARARILGAPVEAVDLQSAVQRLAAAVDAHRADPSIPPALVVTLNPEMVMLARRDAGFAEILEGSAMLVPDGIGVVRALRRRGFPGVERLGGVELLEAYLPVAAARGHRLALAGAGTGVAEAAAARLRSRYPNLPIVAADGGDPGPGLVRRLREGRPDVVCAAFGQGRQERFLREHLGEIGAAAGVGVGGWLDYVARRAHRAPRPVRDAGLEWAWRLLLQPSRLRRQRVLPLFWVLERREAALLGRVQRRG